MCPPPKSPSIAPLNHLIALLHSFTLFTPFILVCFILDHFWVDLGLANSFSLASPTVAFLSSSLTPGSFISTAVRPSFCLKEAATRSLPKHHTRYFAVFCRLFHFDSTLPFIYFIPSSRLKVYQNRCDCAQQSTLCPRRNGAESNESPRRIEGSWSISVRFEVLTDEIFTRSVPSGNLDVYLKFQHCSVEDAS